MRNHVSDSGKSNAPSVNTESVDSVVNSFTSFMNENSEHVFGSMNFRADTNRTSKNFKQ